MELKDMELCEALWNEYEPYLRRICNYRLSDYPVEAEEVIGEVYLVLCDAINNGVELTNPKAWLYGTMNHHIKNKYGEIDKRRNCISLESVSYRLFYNVDFDSARINDETLEKIRNDIIDSLDEEDKALLKLFYEERRRLKEVARILNLTEPAVKQRNYRLKRKVKELVKEELEKL